MLIQACGEDSSVGQSTELTEEPVCERALSKMPYATEVVSFSPGVNSGHGKSELPDIVLGPPKGKGIENGSLHVLSLGVGGEIILSFGNRKIINGEGPDFVVFENPFAIGGDAGNPFAELAQVSVSSDGESWISFGCESGTDYPWPGCAGWGLVNEFNGCTSQIESTSTGGDLFDLEEVGLEEARFVRIVDLADSGSAPSAGFDLDAVGAFHIEDLP